MTIPLRNLKVNEEEVKMLPEVIKNLSDRVWLTDQTHGWRLCEKKEAVENWELQLPTAIFDQREKKFMSFSLNARAVAACKKEINEILRNKGEER